MAKAGHGGATVASSLPGGENGAGHSAPVIDPATHGGGGNDDSGGAGEDSGGATSRRRGRPPGSGNKPKGEGGASSAKEKVSFDLSGLESILLSIHGMLAAATGNPLLDINESEAKLLATAAGKVQRHYPMKASAEALDWCNLAMVVMTVYGTRVMAFKMTAKKEEPVPSWQGQVIPGGFTGGFNAV